MAPELGIAENRRASRIILIDERGRVLLFRYRRWSGGSFWATPGGGVEENETFEEAALREGAEELGIRATSATFLWERVVDISYPERQIRQLEHYFQLEGEVPRSFEAVQKEHEREGILETRWWTIADLQSTNEVVFPEELPIRLMQRSR
jgi:8-oxo-dGTP pyrophosphatase MutT (NUDIX family)